MKTNNRANETQEEKIDRLKFREDKNLSLGASFLLNYGLEKCKINTEIRGVYYEVFICKKLTKPTNCNGN